VLLVYLSADGLRPDDSLTTDAKDTEVTEQSGTSVASKRSSLLQPKGIQRTGGGVAMAGWGGHKQQQQRGEGEEAAPLPQYQGNACASQCLYPTDLLPFTRKKLFLIVESDNSAAFRARSSPPSSCNNAAADLTHTRGGGQRVSTVYR
jgi:hypothetical protein